MDKLYPINGLFFYKLIFMALLILGEAIFCYKLAKKDHFAIRLTIGIIACFIFALAFPIPTSNDFYSMMMFFCMFAFTYLVSLFLFKADKMMILFCLICGYTIEHIAYELYLCLTSFIVAGDSKFGGLYNYDSLKLFDGYVDLVLWIVSYINIYWIMLVTFAHKIEKGRVFEKLGGGRALAIGTFFIIIDIVINSVVSFYSSIHYERIFVGLIALVNMICCVIGISFIFEMYYLGNMRREYSIIREIRNAEKDQYQLSKETIDMINIKCHDFRHQIVKFGKEQNINDEAIKSINNLIDIYDSSIKTTNNALNVILSEKSLICLKYDIVFSCIVNGDLLSFMQEEDIYSLFGNILDNAIDAVKDLEKEQKTIRLKIKSVGNIISISSKNFYDQELTIENGLPKSNKGDSNYHGFGLKSVRSIAEKYNGSMNISTENNVFEITLMFIQDDINKSN